VRRDASSGTRHVVKLALRYAVTGGVPRRSLVFALIVGSILNLINQGDRLIDGHPLNFIKLALTYCVPYFSSTYGAVAFRLFAARRVLCDSSRLEEEQDGHSSRDGAF
jgi:hypothetical protein